MAKAEEFRWAAKAVLVESDQIKQVAAQVVAERENVGIEGGTILGTVDQMVARIVDVIGSISDACCEIGDELLRRATCCDEYTEELRQWLEDKRAYDELLRHGNAPFVPLRPRPEPCCFWCEASI